MKTEISTYEQQAIDFLTATNTEFTAEFKRHGKYWDNDTDTRDIYSVTLKRGNRKFTFDFGQSIKNSGQINLVEHLRNKMITQPLIKKYGSNYAFDLTAKKEILFSTSLKNEDLKINPNYSAPTAYDVLTCLTKSDPGTFENFCDDFGYDTDSRSAEKTYKAVVNEWQNIQALFTDAEIEQLQEIQ